MREFDSPALSGLRRILQTSTGPPQIVELQDEIIQQVVDLLPVVRRGLTPGRQGGLFTASILNTHVGSDTITGDVNPYAPSTTFVGNGYPAVVDPQEFDVWLLQAYATEVSGGGDFGGGVVGLLTDALGMGWRNEANAIAVRQDLMVFNQETDYGGVTHLTDSVSGTTFLNQQGGMVRIGGPAADTRIRFRTVKAGVGAATYKLFMTLGVFPRALGQDGK